MFILLTLLINNITYVIYTEESQLSSIRKHIVVKYALTRQIFHKLLNNDYV